ncbi:MAG: hypothetical protein HZA78_07975 [Candidatus Schekmanbacteria bacterium]|nr:hypothetical protein [Candidatus Schekmanbacteria bacterium]
MQKEHFEILLEHIDSNVELILEGHAVLNKRIDNLAGEVRDLRSDFEFLKKENAIAHKNIFKELKENRKEHKIFQQELKELRQETKDIRKELAEFRRENDATHAVFMEKFNANDAAHAANAAVHAVFEKKLDAYTQDVSDLKARVTRLETTYH